MLGRFELNISSCMAWWRLGGLHARRIIMSSALRSRHHDGKDSCDRNKAGVKKAAVQNASQQA